MMLPELKHEAASTRKMLERIPASAFDFTPHQKSMKMGRLATHVAEIYGYLPLIMDQEELDFATRDYKPKVAASEEELMSDYDATYAKALASLENATDEQLMAMWTLRAGDHIIMQVPRAAAIRGMVLNHLVHHRGQLSVYLRQNDIPVPGMYGPTADEQ